MITYYMKKLATTIAGAATYLSLAGSAFAQTIDPCPQGDFNALCSKFQASDTGRIIGVVLTFLLIAAVVVALFFLIWGGIRWITSGGDKTKVESARGHIIAAIIGLIIAFVAYFIVQIILNIFGLGPVSRLELPTF